MAILFKIQYINSNNQDKTVVNTTEEMFNKNLQTISDKGFTLVKKCKLYPVGKFTKYQHVFYNANDRAWNALYDAQESGTSEEIDKAYEWKDKVEDLLSKFDFGYQDKNGMVYAEYEDYKAMKDIIGEYAWRHDGRV